MAGSTVEHAGAQAFYEAALSEAERADLPVAKEVSGLDEELAMLRLRLRTALKSRPEDLALMIRGLDALRRMVAVKYGLSKSDRKEMSPFLEETLRQLQKRGEGGADA
jgi:hypothetical protein